MASKGVAAFVGFAVAAAWLHAFRRRRHAASKKTPAPIPPAKLRIYGFRPIDVPYEYIDYAKSAQVPAPKGKRPFATGGVLGGDVMGDAHFVVEHLRRAGYGRKLDSWLSAEQKALATAFRAMLEESVYWGMVHVRYASSEFERVTIGELFSAVPTSLRAPVAERLRAKVLEEHRAQGTGRHTDAEVTAKIGKQLLAVSTYLGAKRYFFGSRPASIDATVYAYCSCFLQGEWRHGLIEVVQACPNLVEYVERMRIELFPELRR